MAEITLKVAEIRRWPKFGTLILKMEKNLLDIFKELNAAYMNVESRLKAEGFKVRVLQVCRTWEEWVVYPRDFLLKLRNTFLGQPTGDSPGEADGGPLSGDEKDDEDLDGVPLDGAALLKSAMLRGLPDMVASESGVRSSALDLNSHDSDVDDDIDGIPLDEDIDGIPMGNAFGKAGAGGAFVPSKWETVDPEQIEAQAITTSKWDKLNPVTPDPPRIGGESDDSNDDEMSLGASETTRDYDEERRTRLREIELKILQYQDELESGKRSLKTGWTISQQLEHFRRKLMKKSLRDPRGQDNSDSASEKYSSSSRERRPERRSLSPQESTKRPSSHRSRSPYKKSSRDSVSPPSSRNSKLKRGRSRSASDSPKRYRDSRRYDPSPPRKYRSPSPRSSRSSRDFGREVSPVSSSSGRYSSSSTKSPPSRHRSDKHKHRHKY